jgi:DNA invertase Pin-like site-specific DNA recombinase
MPPLPVVGWRKIALSLRECCVRAGGSLGRRVPLPDRRPFLTIAYLRTSSAANVGADKDSDKRQAAAIAAFAKRARFTIVDTYYDQAVSGADPIEARPGFAALLDRIESNGVQTVIVEDATRLARDLITQETGIVSLIERQVRVLTANGDDLTATDDHFKVAMRQIAGAFAQLEKARLVTKLRHARERIRKTKGKCEGRKSRVERKPEDAEVVAKAIAMAKKLRRANPRTGKRLSLRRIAQALAAAGLLNERGQEYNPNAIKRMVEGLSH